MMIEIYPTGHGYSFSLSYTNRKNPVMNTSNQNNRFYGQKIKPMVTKYKTSFQETKKKVITNFMNELMKLYLLIKYKQSAYSIRPCKDLTSLMTLFSTVLSQGSFSQMSSSLNPHRSQQELPSIHTSQSSANVSSLQKTLFLP